MIDERGENKRDVTIDWRIRSPDHVVIALGRERSEVRHLDRWRGVQPPLQATHHRRNEREWPQPRSIAARDGVFAYETASALQVS
jgi:hypothetical protein